MARLLKERAVDQALFEALNFSIRDDEDLLRALEQMVEADASDALAAEEADRIAIENEDAARRSVIEAEAKLQESRAGLRVAHEHRIVTKRINASFKKREPNEARLIKTLRAHLTRNRAGIVEWAALKGFEKDLLPETQLFAKGGLSRLIEAHKNGQRDEVANLSVSEAEAI